MHSGQEAQRRRGWRTWLVVAAMAGSGGAAMPADLPARHDAAGPGELVLRAAPDARADALTRFGADWTGIEITEFTPDGAWAATNYGQGRAWIAAERLTRQPDPAAQGLPLRCFGMAPFWGLHLPAPFFAEFERPERPELPFQITGTAEATGPGGRARLWTLAGTDRSRASLVMRFEACSDGLTDRGYGLSATFVLTEPTGAVHLMLGCCSLTG